MQGLLGCKEVVLKSLFAGREMVCRLKPCTSIFAMAQWITDILEALPGLTYICVSISTQNQENMTRQKLMPESNNYINKLSLYHKVASILNIFTECFCMWKHFREHFTESVVTYNFNQGSVGILVLFLLPHVQNLLITDHSLRPASVAGATPFKLSVLAWHKCR